MVSTDAAAGGRTLARQVRQVATTPQFIAWTALAFMTMASVASLRPSPPPTVYGIACVFLCLVPGIFLLLPNGVSLGRARVRVGTWRILERYARTDGHAGEPIQR
jgi:hypothetical protein